MTVLAGHASSLPDLSLSQTPLTGNAFTHLIDEELVPTKTGPLTGYRFAVKDIFAVKGLRIQAGNPTYYEQALAADHTAPAIVLLQKTGAQLIGKTHLDELGGALFGLNAHYGSPLNPTSPDRVPGGSSSGSAAAVAAHLVDFALGGDTSGSVRAPASFCGIYGMRPTFGKISTEGVLPISPPLDTVGLFSRHPDLIMRVLDVYGLKQETGRAKRLRLIPSLITSLDDDLRTSFLDKFKKLTPLASSTLDLDIDEETLTGWSTTIRTIAMYGMWQTHKDWITRLNPLFGDLIQERITLSQTVSYEDYQKALKAQDEMRAYFDDQLAPGDVAVFPTVPGIAPLLSTPLTDLKAFALKTSRHTCLSALAGFPEITVPLRHIHDGGSLGISFLGKADTDYSLALLASQADSLLERK